MNIYLGTLPATEAETKLDEKSGIVTVQLSPAVARELRAAVAGIEHPTDGREHAYVTTLRRIGYQYAPRDLLSVAEAIRAGAFAPTALVVQGWPYDYVSSSPSPSERPRDRKTTDLSENLLVMMGALLGEPYGIAGEGDRLVNDLVPTEQDRRLLTGNGSELRLNYHTENAAHRWLFRDRDLSPTGLLLCGICVPEVEPPMTRIANGRIAASKISHKHHVSLEQPCIELALPIRQRRHGGEEHLPASPILSGRAGCETVTAAYYGDMMRIRDDAAEAVTAFEVALDSSSVALLVKPGVMVYVPNGYCLHARDAFTARFDQEGRANRWLQRIFVTARLDAFQIAKAVSERVFELPAPPSIQK